MIVKMGKIRFFPPAGGIPYWDFDYFCKSFRGNGMDFIVETRRATSLHKTGIIPLTIKN